LVGVARPRCAISSYSNPNQQFQIQIVTTGTVYLEDKAVRRLLKRSSFRSTEELGEEQKNKIPAFNKYFAKLKVN
jgi:hypothetical protein